MTVIWLIAEWLGVVLALVAAYLISKNNGKDHFAWGMFLVADAMHAAFYFNNQQYGLVFNQMAGFAIAGLGLFMFFNSHKKELMKTIDKYMMKFCYMFGLLAVGALVKLIINPSVSQLEWLVGFISLAGTTVLAAKQDNAKYGFFGWLTCDVTLLFVAIAKMQFGIILLRIIYIVIDTNGILKAFTHEKRVVKVFFMKLQRQVFELLQRERRNA